MIILTADRIKELREATGITQAELARKLSVTRASVNAWEMGISVPTVDKIVDLSEIFHVSTDYILGVEATQSINISSLNHEEKEIIHRLLSYFDSIRKQGN